MSSTLLTRKFTSANRNERWRMTNYMKWKVHNSNSPQISQRFKRILRKTWTVGFNNWANKTAQTLITIRETWWSTKRAKFSKFKMNSIFNWSRKRLILIKWGVRTAQKMIWAVKLSSNLRPRRSKSIKKKWSLRHKTGWGRSSCTVISLLRTWKERSSSVSSWITSKSSTHFNWQGTSKRETSRLCKLRSVK